MRLFFLGTGSAQGFPSLFGSSPVELEARRLGGRNLRKRSSVLIDGTVQVDLPPDALANVHRFPELNLADLGDLVFTHPHDDHFALRELQYLAPTFAPNRTAPLVIHATQSLVARISREVQTFFDPPPIQFRTLQPFVPCQIGRLELTPLPAHHIPDEVCLNFVVQQDHRRLLYATDTGWYDQSTWDALDNTQLHLVALECGNGLQAGGYDGHLSLEDCVRFRDEMQRRNALHPTARVFLTHIGPVGGLLHDDMVSRAAAYGLDVAYDGLEVDV
ncbi:MAG: MBL fold metallo-hydrolase [Armatimonadaceae bacterium]